MALLAYPSNLELAAHIDAIVNGPDAHCGTCDRDLYAGIDEWHVCTTDDGSGGAETMILCERCHEDEYEAWLDEYDGGA